MGSTWKAATLAGALAALAACSGGGSGGGTPPPGNHLVDLSWDASHDRGVNKPGGGYRVNISGRGTIDVPYVSGAFSPTAVSTTLPTGSYTVSVRSYAALDSAGGTTGSQSGATQVNLVVP
jgi:hypothetical protein